MKRLLAVGIVCLAVAGCAQSASVVEHLDSGNVVVKAGYLTKEQRVWNAAERGCAVHGKVAQPTKVQCQDEACTVKHFHFDCI